MDLIQNDLWGSAHPSYESRLASNSGGLFLFISDLSVPLLPVEVSLLESSSRPGDLLLLRGRSRSHSLVYSVDVTHSDTVMDRVHTFGRCPAPPSCPTWTESRLVEDLKKKKSSDTSHDCCRIIPNQHSKVQQHGRKFKRGSFFYYMSLSIV